MSVDRSYEQDLLDDEDGIFGLIYLITNKVNGKKYVGQTRSHYKNHDKYRPYGIEFRFKSHINKAECNTSTSQSTYLCNAVRKYGKENFSVEEVEVCELEDLDDREIHWIKEYGTMFPVGYNLTSGGKGARYRSTVDRSDPLNPPRSRGGCTFRSKETRAKMSERMQDRVTEEFCQTKSVLAKDQHHQGKIDRFQGCVFDLTKIDSYIRKKGRAIRVEHSGITANFTSKHETIEQSKERARAFIRDIHNATLSNCGKPVKHE